MSNHNPVSSTIVGVHYRVGRKASRQSGIGEGSFGMIYEGVNLTNNQTVAIKFEPKKSEAPQLRDECRAYKILLGCPGVPQIYHFGSENAYNVLVIDLLGPSLEDMFDKCGRKFSTKTVCLLARQMLQRVQTIHEKSLIYRDIKPDNFLMGRPGTRNSNMVFVVDFGMAKQYRDPKSMQHIPYREKKSLSGTARYMSINTHLGREQSRRDDLEALGHVFMYFARGSLPWQGLKAATNKQKYEKIGEKKQTTSIKELCDGYPEEFAIYLNYVRKLGFEETPDYDFLRELFRKVIKNMGEADDGIFDWMVGPGAKAWDQSSVHSSTGQHPQVARLQQQAQDSYRMSGSQTGHMPPPSPALVRNGSARRKSPLEGFPTQMGSSIPNSNAAHVGIPPANGAAGTSESHYGRASPMVAGGSSVAIAQPVVSEVRATGEGYDAYAQQHGHSQEQQPSTLWKILTCRCG
ncbi:putative casein kinase [Auriculariales sp. MPI-PUGE-AT-0066]|nr:putative casein kinase [Auriculariales sp. MPI-PUGE-AT-0066]